MSVLLQCHRLTHAVGTKTLFDDIAFIINQQDRIGLVGHNGSGKSTLLSLLSGAILADQGDISRGRGLRVESVEQFIDSSLTDLTLYDALLTRLSPEDRDNQQYRVEMLLQQFGFTTEDFQYRVSDLSGGQQNRLMFSRAVINDPELILFDEPTNHLDLKTLLYFEQFLNEMETAFVLVSHDRELLDSVTDHTFFLRDQRLYGFSMPFSQAQSKLVELDIAAANARKAEEKKISELKASARRIALWGKVYDNKKLARKAKSIEKRIGHMEESKTFVSKGSGLNLSLEAGNSRAKQMLRIENQNIPAPGSDARTLFHISDMLVSPGDRIALLGHNGVGKTTLIKWVMSQYQNGTEGDTIKFNPQVSMGYYDQELGTLDPGRSLVETLRDHCIGSENEYKTALIKAGFPYLDLDKQVGVLSGGERARLMFLCIKLNQPNFLILDEPTNHIDIDGKEQLEQQILDSGATVLITSHDRRFVDVIADRYLLINEGKLTEIDDPLDFYRLPSLAEYDNDYPDAEVVPNLPADEDLILQRIVELEVKLAEDLARKPKFQKPKLQIVWQSELAELNRQLL